MARVSFKVAPGVRISASSRGVRTSIGNSSGRVSFGGGRTYTSAKVGGVRVSQTHATRTSHARPPRTGSSSPRPTVAQLERETKSAELARIELALTTLHLETFTPAAPGRVPAPTPTDVDALITERRKEAVKGINVFRRSARRAAMEQAALEARGDAQRRDAANDEHHRALQAQADAHWQLLVAHDPATVITTLDAAFADNASEATCVDAGSDEGRRYATVVIVFGPVSAIPEHTAALTPSGRPTTRKRTKTDRNSVYVRALGSTVLATVKEAFAVAPSLDVVKVVVLRRDGGAPTPDEYLTVIYTAVFDRRRTQALPWADLNPAEVLLGADDAAFQRKGAAGDVVPVGVDDDGLAELVHTFAEALRTGR